MNGRIFDPGLGRFLSADAVVDDAGDSQSFNRYSYVSNNPLTFTDPTGYWKAWTEGIGQVVQIAAAYYTAGLSSAAGLSYSASEAISAASSASVGYTINGNVGAAQGLAAGLGGAAGAGLFNSTVGFYVGYSSASAFSGTLLNGGSIGDAFKNGMIAGATAYAVSWASGKIGEFFDLEYHGPVTFKDPWIEAGRALAHGVVGGAASVAQGGSFGSGFYGSFAGSIAGSISMRFKSLKDSWGVAVRTTIAAIAGGTASLLGGGKFANGAITAAFQHLLNAEAISSHMFHVDEVTPVSDWYIHEGEDLRIEKMPDEVTGATLETLEQLAAARNLGRLARVFSIIDKLMEGVGNLLMIRSGFSRYDQLVEVKRTYYQTITERGEPFSFRANPVHTINVGTETFKAYRSIYLLKRAEDPIMIKPVGGGRYEEVYKMRQI
ncbi:hypothetical protein K0B96_09800 [Horticoccus luteus]|uniref:RHS repeat-associated protein n=1 Tax=Horticoccus luteus TaxID=2862869 RepID=A0A8F9XFY6_9BACT|nr:RHS repeat-associated core domain-containing protein [Horticoccus luteus]QYM77620.1 hypothetical protein K0B96_09800 [Horticoccus luteus]